MIGIGSSSVLSHRSCLYPVLVLIRFAMVPLTANSLACLCFVGTDVSRQIEHLFVAYVSFLSLSAVARCLYARSCCLL